MENKSAVTINSGDRELIVRIVLSSWKGQKNRLDGLLEKLTDSQLETPVSESKNPGVYVLGHIISIADMLLPNLGFGELTYPELTEAYFKSPYKSDAKPLYTVKQLKEKWNAINEKLDTCFSDRPIDEWFTKYPNISDDDFFKNPLKNKLELLLFKTNHFYYHIGQLILLKK